MPPHRLLVAVLLSAALLPREARGDEPAPFTPEDVWRLRRVSDPVPSPDGRWVAYSVTETDLAADARRTHLRLVGMDGAGDRRITWSSAGSDYAPAWSPDGRSLGFLSTRAGDAQVHLLPLADGGEARRVTDFPGGIGTFLLTPDGQGLVFAARTVPGCGADRECIRRTDDGRKRRRDTGQLHEHLLYRHWDTYEDGKVQHLFRQGLEPGAAMVDLTPDLARDALTFWLASAGREMDLSPDGRWLFFAGNQDPDRALSYDHQVFRVPLAGGAVEVVTANPAADMQPRVSPDGSTLAWRATRRPGYESDRFELMVAAVEGGEPRSLTPDTDLSVSDFFWDPRGAALFFEAEDRGNVNLYRVPLRGGTVTEVLGPKTAGRGEHISVRPVRDGRTLVYLYRTIHRAWEVMRWSPRAGGPEPLTGINDDLYRSFHFPGAEEVWWQGADGLRIQGFLVPPRAYDPARRYPLLVRLHGGPQQMFGYAFRNELAIFSGAGYFVLLCNPRGSSGYGQAFADASRADWGGQPVEDIRRGVRHVLEAWPAIDPRRVGAWGGSYGGYVVNWLQGHNDDGLFAALASHAGSADRWSAWGTTEELWFPEWEMLGPPWEQPDLADRWSPIRYAESFRTPQLITHGDRDYRVRVSGAEAMFTALQRRGVPSRMLRFPDEGHWIQKPHNQQLWYRTVLDWFDEWLQAPVRGPGGDAP